MGDPEETDALKSQLQAHFCNRRLGFRAWGLGFSVWGLEFGVLRVWGLGFRV